MTGEDYYYFPNWKEFILISKKRKICNGYTLIVGGLQDENVYFYRKHSMFSQ